MKKVKSIFAVILMGLVTMAAVPSAHAIALPGLIHAVLTGTVLYKSGETTGKESINPDPDEKAKFTTVTAAWKNNPNGYSFETTEFNFDSDTMVRQ